MAITGRIPPDAELTGEDFADNEFALVTAPGDPLAKRPWVAIQ